MNFGPGEIIVIVAVLILIFGKDRLKDLAKGTGQASRELKKARKEFQSAFTDEVETHKDKKGS